MELLVVISHPHTAIRDLDGIVCDLAQAYDPAYGSPSTPHTTQLPGASVLLLKWGGDSLGWSSWYENKSGILATAGLPLLHSPPGPPGKTSSMLTPDRLSKFVQNAANDQNGLAYCGGYFAAAHVGRDGDVRMATNYLGEVPLYRASKDGVTVWSNKAAATAMLAGIEPKLDPQAAREFILLSHCLENRTLWAGVEIEPPATCITLDQNGMNRQPYLDLPGAYFAHPQPPSEAAREVVQAMAPLVEALRDSSQEVRLHLTGGQDSRAVSAICRHYGLKPLCLTHGTPNKEVPSAKRLARFLGMPYRTVDGLPPDPDQFMQQANQSMWLSDGLMSLKYLPGRYDLAYIRDEGYLPVEGFGGEYGRAYYYGSDQVYAAIKKNGFDPIHDKLFSGRERWWQNDQDLAPVHNAIDSVLARAQANGLDPWQTMTWFYVNQRVRRWGTARRNAGWTWVIDPLLMPCWTYRAMSAPPEDQRGDGLIRAVIEAAWPGTTKVPTVPELAYGARRRRVASNRIMRNAMKIYDKIRKPMPEPWQTQTLRAMRKTLVQEIGEAQEMLKGIVKPQTAERWLDSEPWSYVQTEMFWHTYTLAVWGRVFLRGPARIKPCHAPNAASLSGGKHGV